MSDQEIIQRINQCRVDLSDIGPYIHLDELLLWGTLSNRKRNERLGLIDFAFDVLRNRACTHVEIRACLWTWLQGLVIVDDSDDVRELEPINGFVDRGGIELAARELIYSDDRSSDTALLSALAWCSMNPAHTPRIISTGVHKLAISYIDSRNWEVLDISMALLRGLCARRGRTRKILRADGAQSVVIPMLVDLNATNDDIRLRRSFRAASTVARLAENDESGKKNELLNFRRPH